MIIESLIIATCSQSADSCQKLTEKYYKEQGLNVMVDNFTKKNKEVIDDAAMAAIPTKILIERKVEVKVTNQFKLVGTPDYRGAKFEYNW